MLTGSADCEASSEVASTSGANIGLPVLEELSPPRNTMSKIMQQKLWKKQFDFSEPDR